MAKRRKSESGYRDHRRFGARVPRAETEVHVVRRAAVQGANGIGGNELHTWRPGGRFRYLVRCIQEPGGLDADQDHGGRVPAAARRVPAAVHEAGPTERPRSCSVRQVHQRVRAMRRRDRLGPAVPPGPELRAVRGLYAVLLKNKIK